MTNEEAIKELKYSYNENITDNEAIDMAINALSQKPYGDCISRQEVLYLVGDYDLSMGQVVKGIHALPPVTPQPKTGHWIFDEILDKHYYCSECKSMGVDYWDYCPHCGARMYEPQERSEI
jgi:hypothetical protein